jgi:2-(1,2-epoxy-1,2-dihydrophenyl)acetyl-CoA isomerase
MQQLLRERVRLAVDGSVGTISLARPGAGNALDLDMTVALREAAHRLTSYDGLRVVRLDADGRAFCVGGDLREFAGAGDPSAHVAEVAAAAHDALTVLRELPVPVVSVVQGVAAGGGVGLALVANLVLMARSATLRVAYTAAGLSPDCGVTLALGRALGPARAMDLALTNRALSAEQAEGWGLVSRVVDDGALGQEADAVVQLLATGAHEALRATKDLVRSGVDADWRGHLDAEAASIARLAGTPDGREGVAAFLQKRPPRFG